MIIIKVRYHCIAFIQKVLFCLIYGTKLKIGKKTTWRRNFSVMKTASAQIEIGDNCFFNNDCSINANNLIKIGSGTLFGENVKIYDHNHRFNSSQPIKEQGFSNGTVIIGNRCWIGSNVTLLKGCEIGDNCVIGAGCVVSGSIPDNSIMKLDAQYTISDIKYRN